MARSWMLAIFLALRNLQRHLRRSLTALLAISFGVIALLVAGGYVASLFEEFREATIQSQYGHIQITRPGFHEAGRSDPYSYLLPSRTDELVRNLPPDARLAPRLLVNGLASSGEITLPFVAEGIDPAVDMIDDHSLRIVEGRRLTSDDEQHLLVGQGLANLLEVGLGDQLVLLVNAEGGMLSAAEGEVVGIFSSFSREFDDAALLMPLKLARTLSGVESAHAWLVFLNETRQTDGVTTLLQERLEAGRYEITPWHDLAEFYQRAAALFDQQLGVMKLLVMVIILLGIGNTMMMSVLERTGEIGTMMAMGTRKGFILRELLIEGALLGILGTLVGVLITLGLAELFDLLGIEMPPPPGFTRGYNASLLITPSLIVEAAVLACLTTTAAAFYPALRASRMVIVDALRKVR